MKKFISRFTNRTLAVSMLLSFQTTFAQTSKDTIKTGKPNDPMIVNPGKTNDANAMMTDTGFISKNIADNLMEIKLAKIGHEKGSSALVKKAASLMIIDHTAMLNDLRKLSPGTNAGSVESHMGTMPSSPSMPDVSVPAGADFNAVWASQMLTMHEDKIRELEDFISVTQNAELKAVANAALPKIKTHRDLLEKIPGAKAGGPKEVMQ